MLKQLIFSCLFACAVLCAAIDKFPAYRFIFNDTQRADNATLQAFQKKDMKLYTFVADKDCPSVVCNDKGAEIPAQWSGSYRTGDRRLFAGDRLELHFSGTAGANAFSLRCASGQPLRWGKEFHQALDNAKSVSESDGSTRIVWSIPEALDRKYLKMLLIKTEQPLTMYEMRLIRPNRNNRLQADETLAVPPKTDVKVRNINGAATITIDGVPFNALGFGSFVHQQYGNYQQMLGESKFQLAFFVVNLGEDIITKWNTPSWIGPDCFDFSAIDRMAKKLIKEIPDVKIILQVQLDGAEWWCMMNPASAGISGNDGVPDYQSEKWRHDCRDAVRQMVAHIQQSDYAEHIIGYELFNGHSMDCNFEVNDKTFGALQRFRDMLRKKYKSAEALQHAWQDRNVTFENATPVSLGAIADGNSNWQGRLLIDAPEKMTRYFDSKQFRETFFQRTILDFADWIKEATHNRRIVGARTGDFMANQWNFPNDGLLENDCNPIEMLLQSPNFDFFDIQPPYIGRHKLGIQGGGIPHLPRLSLLMHNKMVLIQDDIPHLVKTANFRDMMEMKRLVACYSLFNGFWPYQFLMSHYKLNSPYLLADDRRMAEIYDKAIQSNRESTAEAVLVFDLDYQRYLGVDREQRKPSRMTSLLDHLKWTWNRAGIPVDMITLQDLPKAKEYKLYIFVHTFDASPEKMRIMESACKKDGKVALFIWADGFFDGARRSEASMQTLIGMTVKASNQPAGWKMLPTPLLHQSTNTHFPLGIITDTAPGETGAAKWQFSPSFSIDDPKAIALGYDETGKNILCAYREHNDWTSIYSASAILSPALLRFAAYKAGCHQYFDTEELFWINRAFIAIHTFADGERTFRFASPEPLYEVFRQNELMPAKDQRFTVEANRTYIFFRGTKQQWDAMQSRTVSAPWQEPSPAELRMTPFSGKDNNSGALWKKVQGGYHIHAPSRSPNLRLIVKPALSQEAHTLSGTVQVLDKRSNDGIGIALIRFGETQPEIIERRIVKPNKKTNIQFEIPAKPGDYRLMFDNAEKAYFDTTAITGFNLDDTCQPAVYQLP